MAPGAEREVEISTDVARLDLHFIHAFLSGSSYWARGRSRELVERSVRGSLCFGAYARERQLGFARVVTDRATFAWLCDVFVDPAHRGVGVGKRLVEAVVAHPELSALRRIVLATRDAHGLYERSGGFAPLANPADWLARVVD